MHKADIITDIESKEVNVIDSYNIWYKYSYDSLNLYDEYEQTINGYIQQHNKEIFMNYYSSNENNLTIISYISSNISLTINITKFDDNNYNVKVILINLLKDIDIDDNNEYNEIYNNIKQTKNTIIGWNNYFNLITPFLI